MNNRLFYDNPPASARDLEGWRMEGPGAVSVPRGRMRLEGTVDPDVDHDQEAKPRANRVFWCPVIFSDSIAIAWEFCPFYEPGLAIFFGPLWGRRGRICSIRLWPPGRGLTISTTMGTWIPFTSPIFGAGMLMSGRLA